MIGVARRGRIRVDGDSMLPVLRPGDRLVLSPTRRGRLRAGDLAVVRDPREPSRRMVKRIVAVDGRWAWVRGDNPAASTDSAAFGWVALPPVVGRPVRRYAPADRAGPLAEGVAGSGAVTTTPPAPAGGPDGSPGRSAE